MGRMRLAGQRQRFQNKLMSVYRLYETDNVFLFNQTSLMNFDGRNTVSFGLGGRHINDSETVITGLNAFFDYETGSTHNALGSVQTSSMLEFRTNKYTRASSTLTVDGINETALDGYDVKLTANLPYFYSSDVYFTRTEWNDGEGYTSRTDEFGLNAEVMPIDSFGGPAKPEGSNR